MIDKSIQESSQFKTAIDALKVLISGCAQPGSISATTCDAFLKSYETFTNLLGSLRILPEDYFAHLRQEGHGQIRHSINTLYRDFTAQESGSFYAYLGRLRHKVAAQVFLTAAYDSDAINPEQAKEYYKKALQQCQDFKGSRDIKNVIADLKDKAGMPSDWKPQNYNQDDSVYSVRHQKVSGLADQKSRDAPHPISEPPRVRARRQDPFLRLVG